MRMRRAMGRGPAWTPSDSWRPPPSDSWHRPTAGACLAGAWMVPAQRSRIVRPPRRLEPAGPCSCCRWCWARCSAWGPPLASCPCSAAVAAATPALRRCLPPRTHSCLSRVCCGPPLTLQPLVLCCVVLHRTSGLAAACSAAHPVAACA